MEKNLYVTDLDGTLLGTDSRLSDESIELLNRAINRGTLISVATARTPATVRQLLSNVKFNIPLIVMTGSTLWNMQTGRYLSPHFMCDITTRQILEISSRHHINPFTYTLDQSTGLIHSYHSGELDRRMASFAYERANLPLKKMHINHPIGASYQGKVIFFFAMGPKDRIFECAAELKKATDASVSAYHDIFNHEYALLEIFANGVSKASALRELKGITGATHITVFGDNLNDLAMMKEANCAVAVDNAFAAVKEQADIVIESNVSNSVARYIYEHS